MKLSSFKGAGMLCSFRSFSLSAFLKHHFEVHLRYVMLWPEKKYGTRPADN